MSQVLFRNLNPEYITYRKQLAYRSQVNLCVVDAFKQRKFSRSEQNWDIFWLEKQSLDNFYMNHRVNKDQRVNHFRTYHELCRKDNLNRNIKKYKRTLQRQGKNKEAQQYNFVPMTYHLPIQYAVFLDEFKKLSSANKHNIWIMKPTSKSQGKGIFLFNKLSAIQQWAENIQAQNYICQKYIQKPLLIGHKKFDLRLYVLCTSYRPLNIYLYREGFARLTHYRYDQQNILNLQSHLTNVAIQKHTSQYNKQLGGKMSLSSLKLHLLSKYPSDTVHTCFYQIRLLITKTLQSVTKVMSNQPNCFELYGFDIMLDQSFHPYLIQVNGSPSMRANTKSDKQLKIGLIDDLLTVIDLQKVRNGSQDIIGGFDLICKNNQKYQSQYYSGINGMTMLGCKLQREKNYRAMAALLNSHYRNNTTNNNNNTTSNNIKSNNKNIMKSPIKINRVLPTSQQINSPTKKGFSVRKQKRGNSFVKSQVDTPPQSQSQPQPQPQLISLNPKQSVIMIGGNQRIATSSLNLQKDITITINSNTNNINSINSINSNNMNNNNITSNSNKTSNRGRGYNPSLIANNSIYSNRLNLSDSRQATNINMNLGSPIPPSSMRKSSNSTYNNNR